MRNCTALLPLLMSFIFNIQCYPVSQPAYQQNSQYQPQAIPTLTYRPQQIHYKPAPQGRPVYEARPEGLQAYANQQKSQPSPQGIQTAGHRPVQQVFLPTNQGPRQVDASYYQQLAKQQQPVQYRPQPQLVAQPVYQPQKVSYQAPQPQPQYSARYQQPQPQPRPQVQRADPEENDEEDGEHDPNPSYQFGFDVKDDQYTNYQTRKEERDGKKITGSYSVVDADGYIRTVKYTADPKEGFKAEVTREPTDIVVKIPKPDPQFQTLPRHQPPAREQPQYAPQREYQQQPRAPQQTQYTPQRGYQQQRSASSEEQNVLYRYE